ncbi:hypothetical protein BH23ACT10_BH23ACT10_37590 [soil metagenome]
MTLTVDETVIEFADTTDETAASTARFTSVWYGPDGEPAERGRGEDLAFEVTAEVGARHCEWESIVFLAVAWPPGSTWEVGDAFPDSVHIYVRDPARMFRRGDVLTDDLELDTELPGNAEQSGYETGAAELWWGPDNGEDYAYVMTDKGVERWPRARKEFGCA